MSKFLPAELETEILIRVPVKSLLRFRQVCMRWCSLISSPNFIKKHLSLTSFSPSKTLVRFCSETHSKEIYRLFNDDTFNVKNSIEIRYPFKFFRIVGYCNGVLCLFCDVFGYGKPINLWNPSIKRGLTLPTSTFIGPLYFALGFGYDAKNDDHKVVKIGYVYPNPSSIVNFYILDWVEIFSVSSGMWKRVEQGFDNCRSMFFASEHINSPAVYDGTVHWAGYRVKKYGSGIYQHSLIMTFDLNSDTCGELGLPSEVLAFEPRLGIKPIVLRGLFSMVDFDDQLCNPKNHGNGEGSSSGCAIWVMKDYGNVGSWAKLYRVEFGGKHWQVLGMKRDGEIICGEIICGEIICGCGRWSVQMVTYNCENMATTATGISGVKGSFFVDDYVESLVLLGKGKEVSRKYYKEIQEI